MKLYDYFYLARKDLFNFKLRSGLIILCIAIGILSATLNLYHASKRAEESVASLSNLGSQMISIWVRDENVHLQDFFFLSSYFPLVSYESCEQKRIKYLRKSKEAVSIIGSLPEYKTVHSLKTERGRFINMGDEEKRLKVCVINTALKEGLGIRVGTSIKIGEDKLRVIGIVKEIDVAEARIIIPLSIYNDVVQPEKKNFEIVMLTNGNPEVLRKDVERMLKKRFPSKKHGTDKRKPFHGDERFMVSTAEGLLDMMKQQKATARMITLGIGVLTLLMAGGGIINLIMLSIRQRYREIGIMRACGARRDDIFYLFLLEGVLLSMYGLCLGGGCPVFS